VGDTAYRFLVVDNASDADRAFLDAQMAWLAEEAAAAGNEPLIIALHIPLGGTEFTSRLQQVFRKGGRPALILAGHRHSDGIEEIALGGRKVPQVRTAIFATNPANVRAVRLFADRIEVGRTGARESIERTVTLK
jgi:hypothetical protein